MNKKIILGLLLVSAIVGAGLARRANAADEPRALYTYSFGDLEKKEVGEIVSLLDALGYSGIAVEARGEEALARLDQYYEEKDRLGDDFEIVSAFMAHRFDKYGFSDEGHRAAIDRLEGKNGTIWVWVRDAKPDGTVTDEKVEGFITGIFEYALSKGVKVVLYPHYNTYYPTVEDALPLVKKIDHPSFTIAINLCHELMSDKGDRLPQTFEMAKGRIGAIILSGALVDLDRSSVRSMNESTILSLDESVYDLRPYLRLIKESDYAGEIGFINFNLPGGPENYLKRTMTRWEELCQEVGLYEK